MLSRLPRITAEEHAAFKLEVPKLRKELNAIRSKRLRYQGDLPRRQTVQELQARLLPCSTRLDHWRSVLTVGRNIRSPVRLWDTWHKLDVAAWLNAFELDYLAEQVNLEPLAVQELARLNDWQFGEKFPISSLVNAVDQNLLTKLEIHRLLYFRERTDPQRAVAVARQLGSILFEFVRKETAQAGLRCHIPPTPTGSWQGRSSFCVFTRPDIEQVRFLMEDQ